MTFTPSVRRVRDRIRRLPEVKHDCRQFGIWVRRPKVTGKLACVICGR